VSEFLSKMVSVSGNKYAKSIETGIEGSDVESFVDTGSYSLNALLSGSIYGGIPDNKIVAIAGESATGKTYFSISIVSQFLHDHPDGIVLYFDSEQAVTSNMFHERNIDPTRVAVFPVATVEDFRHQAIQIVDNYEDLPKKDKKPMMIVLDSLGMLSTSKEMTDTAEGKGTRDMTRAQMIKSTFRVLTLKLGQAGIPMIMTNHTYDVIGSMFPTKQMSGGSGLFYAASTIVYLSRRKVKDGRDITGNIIHCKLYKSRLTKENAQIDVHLDYKEGLHPYYGLVDLGIKYDIFKKVGNRIELPDGTKLYEKSLYKDAPKYFTDDIMHQLDEAANKEFTYGNNENNENKKKVKEKDSKKD